MKKNENVIPHMHHVSKVDRNSLNNHKSFVVWFTGLSGSGKSTLASLLEAELHKKGIRTYILDGDNVRTGLNQDLDFTEAGRIENIRRIGEVANLMVDAGIVVLSAFISPFEEDRKQVAEIVGKENFIEVFVDCPLEVCEQRDVKGLYAKARKGLIKNFTGIDSPFEVPTQPDLVVLSNEEKVVDSVYRLIELVLTKK
jgi:adenylyl-sulfate kinase